MMNRLLHAGTLFCTVILLIMSTFVSTKTVAGYMIVDDEGFVRYQGEITEGDSSLLRNLISSPAHNVQRTLLIMSSGGDVIDSLSSANIITAHRMNVLAAGQCTSACTFILFSGRTKLILENTEVGIHCPSYYMNAQYHYIPKYSPSYWKLYGVLRAGGMSEKLAVEFLDMTFEHKSTKMRILTKKELEYFGVKILRNK